MREKNWTCKLYVLQNYALKLGPICNFGLKLGTSHEISARAKFPWLSPDGVNPSI